MNNLARWETYSPISIGFDDMWKRLDAFAANPPSYPPYNIVKLDEDRQQLQIALAGFSKEEVEVAVERNVLNISVQQSTVEEEYIHKGIASRNFSRNWQLSGDTVVDEVKYNNGMLFVTLRKEIPEEQKRKLLPIS